MHIQHQQWHFDSETFRKWKSRSRCTVQWTMGRDVLNRERSLDMFSTADKKLDVLLVGQSFCLFGCKLGGKRLEYWKMYFKNSECPHLWISVKLLDLHRKLCRKSTTDPRLQSKMPFSQQPPTAMSPFQTYLHHCPLLQSFLILLSLFTLPLTLLLSLPLTLPLTSVNCSANRQNVKSRAWQPEQDAPE